MPIFHNKPTIIIEFPPHQGQQIQPLICKQWDSDLIFEHLANQQLNVRHVAIAEDGPYVSYQLDDTEYSTQARKD